MKKIILSFLAVSALLVVVCNKQSATKTQNPLEGTWELTSKTAGLNSTQNYILGCGFKKVFEGNNYQLAVTKLQTLHS